ncbi:MAG: ROK family protein [Chloroflexia bacterium]|nr:ROK family protein [Chloroflexia bacterium]
MDGIRFAIALDVGGTSVKSGVVTMDSAVVEQRAQTAIDSGGSAESILATFAGIVQRHERRLPETSPKGLALAFPGPFDYDAGVCRIRGVEKYESLFGVNVADELRRRLGWGERPIRFRNDAEAAIAGECLYGAGHGYDRVIGVTLGTGFGSAFMVNGAAQTSGHGVPPNGWLYPYPAGDARADDRFSVRGLERQLREAGGLPVDPEAAAEAAHGGASAGHDAFVAYGAALGSFLAPFAVDFGADAVVVLGGIAGAFDLFGPSLRAALPTPALPGTMGPDAALLGAARSLA